MKSTDFKHLLNLFNSEGPQDPRFIEELLEQIRLTHDAKGTKLFDGPNLMSMSGALATNYVSPATACPAGKLWWIPYCSLEHDSAAAQDLHIHVRDTTPMNIAVARDLAVAATIHLYLSRTIVVSGGSTIRGTGSAIAAGERLYMRMLYFEIDPGDYAFPF